MLIWYDAALQVFSFALFATLAFLIVRQIERRFIIRQRLNVGGTPIAATSVLRDDRVHSGLLNWIQRRTSLRDPVERQRTRTQLMRAGYESPSAPAIFLVLRYGLALALPMAFLAAQSLTGQAPSGLGSVLAPFALCLAGLLLPNLFLKRAIASRVRLTEQQFPDALDLMVVCMDAGLSLEAAMMRVTQEMRRSHPAIAREFERVSEELGAGRSRADALHDLGRRLDSASIRGFVSLLVQSQALGASIAQGLKTYAHEMRNARALRAEEKAMRIPVLISMPLVSCFLPVIVQALMLPAMIDMVRVVVPAMTGGA